MVESVRIKDYKWDHDPPNVISFDERITKFEYDDFLRKKKVEHWTNGEWKSTWTDFKYDSQNNLIEKKKQDPSGFERLYKYTYNNKNQLVELEQNGFRYIWTFDESGREIELAYYNQSELRWKQENYEHDQIGNAIKYLQWLYYDGSQSQLLNEVFRSFTRDSLIKTHVLKSHHYEYDIHYTRTYVEEWEYDDQDRIKSYNGYYLDPSGNRSSYTVIYTFDQYNNDIYHEKVGSDGTIIEKVFTTYKRFHLPVNN